MTFGIMQLTNFNCFGGSNWRWKTKSRELGMTTNAGTNSIAGRVLGLSNITDHYLIFYSTKWFEYKIKPLSRYDEESLTGQ